MKMVRLLLLTLILAPFASAQVTLTFTATAPNPEPGYVGLQSYTFIFTTGPDGSGNPSNIYDPSRIYWGEGTTAETQLFTNISGTGVTGTFARPSDTPGAPYSFVQYSTSGGLEAYFGTEGVAPLTLKSPDGLVTLNRIEIQILGGTLPTFIDPGSQVPLTSFFQNYTGTYSGFSTTNYLNVGNNTFNVTSVTISVVPEPSTYSALLGLGALAFVIVRRRKQAV
jgi:hypothetical protein